VEHKLNKSKDRGNRNRRVFKWQRA